MATKKYKRRNKDKRKMSDEDLVLKYDKYCKSVAKRLSKKLTLPYDDILQCAYTGLLIAYDRFDMDMASKKEKEGVKIEKLFKSYADFYIHSEADEYDRANQFVIFKDPVYSMIKKIKMMEEMHPSRAFDDKIKFYSEFFSYPEEVMRKIFLRLYYYEDILSHEDEVGSPINIPLLINDIPADDITEDVVSRKEECNYIISLIKDGDILTNREKLVLSLYFGLFRNRPHNLIEIAKEFNVTRERIRQILHKAIHKIRKHLKKNGYYNFDEMDIYATKKFERLIENGK